MSTRLAGRGAEAANGYAAPSWAVVDSCAGSFMRSPRPVGSVQVVAVLLRAVHAVELELRLGGHLLETAAGGGERRLVLGRHRQVAA